MGRKWDESNREPSGGGGELRECFGLRVKTGQATVGTDDDMELGEGPPERAVQPGQEQRAVAATRVRRGSVERLRSALGAFRRVSFHTRTQFCSAERVNARRPSARDGLVANGVNVGGAHALPEDSPFPMPARLADGLGLESGPGDLTVRPGPVLRTLGPPLVAPGRRPRFGCWADASHSPRALSNRLRAGKSVFSFQFSVFSRARPTLRPLNTEH